MTSRQLARGLGVSTNGFKVQIEAIAADPSRWRDRSCGKQFNSHSLAFRE